VPNDGGRARRALQQLIPLPFAAQVRLLAGRGVFVVPASAASALVDDTMKDHPELVPWRPKVEIASSAPFLRSDRLWLRTVAGSRRVAEYGGDVGQDSF